MKFFKLEHPVIDLYRQGPVMYPFGAKVCEGVVVSSLLDEQRTSTQRGPKLKRQPNLSSVPREGLLRLHQVLQVIPISKSTWYAGIKSGKYPEPIKLGGKLSFWKAEDIWRLADAQASPSGAP
jgi:prophage regulatory protein